MCTSVLSIIFICLNWFLFICTGLDNFVRGRLLTIKIWEDPTTVYIHLVRLIFSTCNTRSRMIYSYSASRISKYLSGFSLAFQYFPLAKNLEDQTFFFSFFSFLLFYFICILQEGVGTEVTEYKPRKIMKNWSGEPFQTKADQRGPGKIIYSCEQKILT